MGVYCAVPGCFGSQESKHRFPNPGKYPQLFQMWILACGRQELLERPPENIYKNCRICHKHFTENHCGRNNTILKNAIPTEHLPVIMDVSTILRPGTHSCCICCKKIAPTFKFPNPNRFLERFVKWKEAVNSVRHVTLTNQEIFRRSFVCAKHFRYEDFEEGIVKLLKTAVPSQNLSDGLPNVTLTIDLPESNVSTLMAPDFLTPPKEFVYYLNCVEDSLKDMNPRKSNLTNQGDVLINTPATCVQELQPNNTVEYVCESSRMDNQLGITPLMLGSRDKEDRKPKQDNINVLLFDETNSCEESLNAELLVYHDSLEEQSTIQVTDTTDRCNTDNTLNTKNVNVNNDTNEINEETELPSEKINQKHKGNKREYCLTVENMNVVCRTCLKQNDCRDLFSNCLDNLNCAKILEMFTCIKLDPQDGLSMNICIDCISELVHCYTFRQKCQESQDILQEFKSEIEKVRSRNLSNAYTLNVPLLDHDYEHINNEVIINNILRNEKEHEADVNNKNCDAEQNNAVDETSKAPKYLKRYFYVLKSNLNENKLTDIDKNIIEINEKKAQLLIKKSGGTHQKIFLSEEKQLALDNEKITCTNEIQHTNVRRDNINKCAEATPPRNSLTARAKNKYMIMKQARLHNRTFSDTIEKAIKLVLDGRIRQANRLAKSVPKTRNRRRRKVREKKNVRLKVEQVFPGNCRVCDVPLLNKSDYLEHAKAFKHYFIDFTCDICSKVYSTKHRLIIHKQSHTIEKRYMCEKCGLRFRQRSALIGHMKVHFKNTEQSFVCKTCGDVFKYKLDFIKHRRLKHMEKKVCCEICGVFLINKPCLMQHKKRIHMNTNKREKCFICDKEVCKFLLQKHIRTHTADIFKCKLCNCHFKYQYKHARHMKNRHPGADGNASLEDEIQMTNCLHCEEICRNKQSVSIHMSEVHDDLVCKYCDAIFRTDNDLTTHYVTHSNIKDCSCRYCGKSYESWANLYIHLGGHGLRTIRRSLETGTKSYPCQYCSKRFLYKQSVKIHERTHTGERPYVCDVCGKGCMCASSFKKHRHTHFLQNGQKIL